MKCTGTSNWKSVSTVAGGIVERVQKMACYPATVGSTHQETQQANRQSLSGLTRKTTTGAVNSQEFEKCGN